METEKRALVLPDRVIYGSETDQSARQTAFLREFRKRGIRADGLRLAQVGNGTLKVWLKDPDFREQYHEAKDMAAAKLQRAQWNSAIQDKDPVSQRWLLARYNPAEFGDKLELQLQPGGHDLRAFVPAPVEIEELDIAEGVYREVDPRDTPGPSEDDPLAGDLP